MQFYIVYVAAPRPNATIGISEIGTHLNSPYSARIQIDDRGRAQESYPLLRFAERNVFNDYRRPVSEIFPIKRIRDLGWKDDSRRFNEFCVR